MMENEIQLKSNNVDKHEGKCPKTKNDEFLCPRCGYSQPITERKEFFNATTWWYCKYPEIVNWKMVTVEDILIMPTTEDKKGDR
jgi:hypothetical protein